MRVASGSMPILLLLLASACSSFKHNAPTAAPVTPGGVPNPATVAAVPSSGTETAGDTQGAASNRVTLSDNGSALTMLVGQDFLLNLGTDTFEWTVDVDNQDVLRRVKNVMVIRGAQGLYEAIGRGNAVLTAQGDPLCRSSVPACMMPSMLFSISITVR